MSNEPELFDPEPGEEDQNDSLPPDHRRKCNHCGAWYWCKVRRSRPTFIPLHCEECERIAAEDLKRRTEIWRGKMRRGELVWADKITATGKPWHPPRPPKPKRQRAVKGSLSPAPAPEPREAHPALLQAAFSLVNEPPKKK